MKTYKSGKQRREELRAARQRRRTKRARAELPVAAIAALRAAGREPVCAALLAPGNSYGLPEFARRGWYEDMPFRCKDCGAACVWTAARQRWWYEVAKGGVFTSAVRCAACRAAERQRVAAARRAQIEGMARKCAGR
ncbi:MAG: zinc-ribbon domain containing protein [Rhodocyclaceae bacterium]|nr:zinc-ribbon domain containing protein [Rhodocyclaceae bacterium]MBX3668092.1 zinc-ribbon domain containing protein [Rhodocyclaceae bacterium]